jgi:hypothetical protein
MGLALMEFPRDLRTTKPDSLIVQFAGGDNRGAVTLLLDKVDLDFYLPRSGCISKIYIKKFLIHFLTQIT